MESTQIVADETTLPPSLPNDTQGDTQIEHTQIEHVVPTPVQKTRKRTHWNDMIEMMMAECTNVAKSVAEETGYSQYECLNGFLQGAPKQKREMSQYSAEVSLAYEGLKGVSCPS